MDFNNVYEDDGRADSYARLEFPGTYYLAYRDLPGIIREHVTGQNALDFGCGSGRSTRFLKELGFEAIGVDISQQMLTKARELDPRGEYRRVEDGSPCASINDRFDLVLSVFTFDNIPTAEKKATILRELRSLLNRSGRIINLVSSPEIYTHEWASFTTKGFPENQHARCGDRVKIIMTDVEDSRPVEDILWTDEGYRDVYRRAGLTVDDMKLPLALDSEPFEWISETEIAPWVIYVLH